MATQLATSQIRLQNCVDVIILSKCFIYDNLNTFFNVYRRQQVCGSSVDDCRYCVHEQALGACRRANRLISCSKVFYKNRTEHR